MDYEQLDAQEQATTTDTLNNVPINTKEQPQQLRQGLENINALNMLKTVHGDGQDVNYNYNYDSDKNLL